MSVGAIQDFDTALAKYAGFWKRVAAILIDSMIVGVILAAAFYASIFLVLFLENLSGQDISKFPSTLTTELDTLFFALLMLIPWLYFALMESSRTQASLGKLIVKIAVADTQGKRLSFGRATGRHFAKMVSALILFAGFVMAGFTEKKQALHDMLS